MASKSLSCDRRGCVNPATHQVALRVWALGQALRTHATCLNMLMTLNVCDGCRDEVKPQDCLTGAMKEKIADACAEMGRALPDFSAAQMNFIPIVGAPLTPQEFVRGDHAEAEG